MYEIVHLFHDDLRWEGLFIAKNMIKLKDAANFHVYVTYIKYVDRTKLAFEKSILVNVKCQMSEQVKIKEMCKHKISGKVFWYFMPKK